MTTNTYTAELVQLCADRGVYAEAVPTGGGCMAVQISYGAAGELLVTNGDAGLPDPLTEAERDDVLPDDVGVYVGDYPTTGTEATSAAHLSGPVPASVVAELVAHYLNTGKWQATAALPDGVTLSQCCVVCGQPVGSDDVHAGHGMCGSCLHDAVRSGWEPVAQGTADEHASEIVHVDDELRGYVHFAEPTAPSDRRDVTYCGFVTDQPYLTDDPGQVTFPDCLAILLEDELISD